MAPILSSRSVASFDAFFGSSAVLATLKALAMMMVILLIGYITLRIRKWRAGRRSTDVESATPSRTILSIAHVPRNLGSVKHVLGLPKVFIADAVTYNLDEPPRTNVIPGGGKTRRTTPLLSFTRVISSSKAPKPVANVETTQLLTSGAQVLPPQREAQHTSLNGDIVDCHFDDSIPSSTPQPLSSSPTLECHMIPVPQLTQDSDVAEATTGEDETPFRSDALFEHEDQGLSSSLPSSEPSWSIYHQSISTIVQSSLHGDTTDHDVDEDPVSSSSLPSLASSWSIHDQYTPAATITMPATPRKSIPRLVIIPPTPPRYPMSVPDIIVTLATPPRRKKAVASSRAPHRKSGKENKSLEMISSKRVDKDVRRVAFTQFKSGNYF
ncbi:hypothetical protein Moror_8624 [Moniliophthora roreri MCA 2997]|uniref:Uncharacterized protein n=1 Tax=Moniliophthora roreri (strain MCA 2997) TaxID=1381753 RepID=V2WS53_MONRO|nr:hypothetical protein Moror_8624 [Moniliophthora roreri MCA 2997]